MCLSAYKSPDTSSHVSRNQPYFKQKVELDDVHRIPLPTSLFNLSRFLSVDLESLKTYFRKLFQRGVGQTVLNSGIFNGRDETTALKRQLLLSHILNRNPLPNRHISQAIDSTKPTFLLKSQLHVPFYTVTFIHSLLLHYLILLLPTELNSAHTVFTETGNVTYRSATSNAYINLFLPNYLLLSMLWQ